VGMTRPTPTSKPGWNPVVGYYWVEPSNGLPVGGNYNLEPARIGLVLPPGWSGDNQSGFTFTGPEPSFTPEISEVATMQDGFASSEEARHLLENFAPNDPWLATLQAGDDLRDFAQGGAPVAELVAFEPNTFNDMGSLGSPAGTAIVLTSRALAARLPAGLRGNFLAWVTGLAAGTRVLWTQLPTWLRSALALIGVSGATIVVDEAFEGPRLPDIQVGGPLAAIGQPGSGVIGSWQANGVTFYRLSDGKLAVQNKRGRWKVWRPKKPIVIYASGATDLKTMLRADAALNKQAKKIAAMLNRRAPKSRKSSKSGSTPVVIAQRGSSIIDV